MKIRKLIPVYLKSLKVLGRSYYTVRGAKYVLQRFARFLEAESADHIEDLNADILSDYQQELYFSLTAKGKPLTLRTQAQTLGVIKGFTRFLKDKDYLIHDPGESIQLPKKPKRLPKVILSPNEVKQLLDAADMRTNRGYRNRIILEVLYDTAIRRDEVRNIRLVDLDLDAGYIRIRGKGNKERVVPLSKRVCELT